MKANKLQSLLLSVVAAVSLLHVTPAAEAGTYGKRIPILRDALLSTPMPTEVRYVYKMAFAYCMQIRKEVTFVKCYQTSLSNGQDPSAVLNIAQAFVNGGDKADKQYRINMEAMRDIR